MMIRFSLAISAALLFAAPAWAQNAACERGASRIMMAGVDLDVMRCQMEIMGQQLAERDKSIAALSANVILSQKDATNASALEMARAKALEDYWAGWVKGASTD